MSVVQASSMAISTRMYGVDLHTAMMPRLHHGIPALVRFSQLQMSRLTGIFGHDFFPLPASVEGL